MTSSRDPEVLVRPGAQLHGVDVVVGMPSKVLELIRGRPLLLSLGAVLLMSLLSSLQMTGHLASLHS